METYRRVQLGSSAGCGEPRLSRLPSEMYSPSQRRARSPGFHPRLVPGQNVGREIPLASPAPGPRAAPTPALHRSPALHTSPPPRGTGNRSSWLERRVLGPCPEGSAPVATEEESDGRRRRSLGGGGGGRWGEDGLNTPHSLEFHPPPGRSAAAAAEHFRGAGERVGPAGEGLPVLGRSLGDPCRRTKVGRAGAIQCLPSARRRSVGFSFRSGGPSPRSQRRAR